MKFAVATVDAISNSLPGAGSMRNGPFASLKAVTRYPDDVPQPS